MASVSVPEATKPITLLADIGRLNEWLSLADSMMARAKALTSRPNTRLQPICLAKIKRFLSYLTGESIHA